MRRLLIISLVLLAAGGCGKKPEPVKAPTPRVKVAKAISKDMPYVVRTIGQVWAYNVVDIMAQVEGQLTGAFVEQGTYVEAGDLLFTIDPRIYESELEQNQGLLEQAEAGLRFGIERVERFYELLPEEYVSKLDYEQYTSQMQEAAGQVEQYQGAVQQAQVNLDFTNIVAPMSGQLGLRNIDPGNIVRPEETTPIISINQIEPININFHTAEQFLPMIQKYRREGPLEVIATVTGEEGKTFKGDLSFIDNQVNIQSGTILMKGEFANKERLLWPGQFCDVQINLYTIPDAVLIPTEAVSIDTKGPFCFVVKEDDTVEQRRLKLGQLFDNDQIVESGVKAGETVVTDGQMMLRPGRKVQIVS
jgi:RND family efflux transporter MFP subunit